MAGNFVAGLVWGGVVAGVGLAVISPMAPLVGLQMTAVTEVTAAEPAPQPTSEPQVVTAPAAVEAAKPEATPETEAAPATPEQTAIETAPVVAKDSLPAAPVSEDATGLKTDALLMPAAPEPAPEAAAQTPPPPEPETTAISPQPTEPAAVEPAPAADPASVEPAAAEPPAVQPAAPPAEPIVTEKAPDPVAPAETLPAKTAQIDPAAGVTTNRLPAIGKSDEAAPPASGANAVQTADNADAPPLVRYARPFENVTGNPPFAILLIDDGSDGLDRAALAALPFAVTFVLDPLAFNAPEAAAIYRNAGQEIAMLSTGIPEGANASDLEQTFQTHDAVLPEAVAYVDLPQGGFQTNRPLATEVVTTLAPRGRGLITYDQGLNAADQVAQRSNMPSAVIFRMLDAENEAAPLVRRYLDRAAFKAAQEGSVIVMGHARPETVAALIEWSVEGKSGTVTIAPVSAILQADR